VLPAFVITLREGVEAALIIGIVAAFLAKQDRRDALKPMWFGIGLALGLCAAVAVGLRVGGQDLPQRQQDGLETIVGLIAVGFVTYMVVWMRRHSRGLKAVLENEAATALAAGSATGLLVMAFLAVLREGFETSVFLLAVFQDTSNPGSAGTGAILGLAAAVGLGVTLYRGGVRINLSRFFRLTGLVVVESEQARGGRVRLQDRCQRLHGRVRVHDSLVELRDPRLRCEDDVDRRLIEGGMKLCPKGVADAVNWPGPAIGGE